MNWFQAVATLLCAVGMALFYFLMDLSRQCPRRVLQLGDKEFHMPDTRFHNTPDALYALLDAAGDVGRPLMKRYWLMDFGFIVSFWGVMIIIALNITPSTTALFIGMGIAATMRALLDLLENGLFLKVLQAYPTRRNTMAQVAGVVTAAKYLCLYAWVGMLFYRLFASAFGLVK